MSEPSQELVVLMTKGADHELSSVALTIANGGITAGFKVYAFLTSAGLIWCASVPSNWRQFAPLDPLKVLIDDFIRRGGPLGVSAVR